MVKTWVNSRWKNPRLTGHFSTEINTLDEPATLLDYMRGNDEEVVMLADFIAAGGDWSLARKLSMGSLVGPDGTFRYKPGEVVFEARPVIIVNDQRRPLPASFLTPYP